MTRPKVKRERKSTAWHVTPAFSLEWFRRGCGGVTIGLLVKSFVGIDLVAWQVARFDQFSVGRRIVNVIKPKYRTIKAELNCLAKPKAA